MCDHGSKVFFEQLGPPWPRHHCPALGESRPSTKPSWAEFVTFEPADSAALKAPKTRPAPHRDQGFDVDPDLVERMRRNARRLNHPIVRIDATRGGKATAEGIVREVFKSADPFKDLRVRSTGAMARAFAGRLGQARLAKLTVHVGSLSDDQLKSYTFFLPRDDAANMSRGKIVRVTLETETVPSHGSLWFCASVSLLEDE
jgi:hypothetical protein